MSAGSSQAESVSESATTLGLAALQEALAASMRLLRLLLALALIAYLASGIFVVPQHERAFVLRFGRPVGLGADRLKGPGLHWTWPRPFSEIVRVPAERVQNLNSESFWHEKERSRQPGVPGVAAALGYSMSGDANVLHHRWSLHFTVADPHRFVFGIKDVERFLQAELERAVTLTSAQFPVEGALRTNLAGFRSAVESLLRWRLDALRLGVHLQAVYLVDAVPPPATASSFEEAVQALQSRDSSISESRADAVRILNEAQAEAFRLRAEGLAARQRRLASMGAWADAFLALREPWRRHRAVTEDALRQNALREILPAAGRIVAAPPAGPGGEIRLNFGPPIRESGGSSE